MKFVIEYEWEPAEHYEGEDLAGDIPTDCMNVKIYAKSFHCEMPIERIRGETFTAFCGRCRGIVEFTCRELKAGVDQLSPSVDIT